MRCPSLLRSWGPAIGVCQCRAGLGTKGAFRRQFQIEDIVIGGETRNHAVANKENVL